MKSTIDPRVMISIPTRELSRVEKKEADLEKLRESTREFEAIYVMEMFKSMRKTIPENGLIKKDSAMKLYQEMMDMELARKTSEGDGMGIGLAMYNQMKEVIENKR